MNVVLLTFVLIIILSLVGFFYLFKLLGWLILKKGKPFWVKFGQVLAEGIWRVRLFYHKVKNKCYNLICKVFKIDPNDPQRKETKRVKLDKKIKSQHSRRDQYDAWLKEIELKEQKKFAKRNNYQQGVKKYWHNKKENVLNEFSELKHTVDYSLEMFRIETLRFDKKASNDIVKKLLFGLSVFVMIILLPIIYITKTLLYLLAGILIDLSFGLIKFFISLGFGLYNLPFKLLNIRYLFKKIKFGFYDFFFVNLKGNVKGYLFLLPALLVLIFFTFYPILNTFLISFVENYDYINQMGSGFGLDNYKRVFADPLFSQAVKNTFFLVFVSVPIAVVLALLIAVGLSSIKQLQGFLQTIFFLPYITNTIAVGLVFSVLFLDKGSSSIGLVNSLLERIGIKPITFFGVEGKMASWGSCMLLITIYSVWNALAFKIMVLLSGIQGISKQYYQAAKIDGAPKVKTFFKITIPMISPMIAYVTITSFIGTFKTYTSIIALYGDDFAPTGRGVDKPLITIVGYIMDKMKTVRYDGVYGRASAAAVILLAIILAFTGIQMWVSGKKVHY